MAQVCFELHQIGNTSRAIHAFLDREFLPRKGEIFWAWIYPLKIRSVEHTSGKTFPEYVVRIAASKKVCEKILKKEMHVIWLQGACGPTISQKVRQSLKQQ